MSTVARALPAHGGRLRAARARFPEAPAPFLDLSTGINPHTYPCGELPAEAFARLPEPEDAAALETTAAQAYGVADPCMVVAAPGTQSLIGLLPRLWPQREVAIVAPTYSEHELAWRAAGAEPREVTEPPAAGQVVVLCNPNNPDGRRWPAGRLCELADSLAARGGLLVVDEAFADLEEDAAELSLAPHLPHPAIVVLRSFGKTYGLAGLRLGFALATSERAHAIRAALGPWAVSGPALAIGRRALADTAWRGAMRTRLAQEAARLDGLLTEAGLRVLGGTRLFRLAEAPDALAFYEQLGRAGLLVRAFPTHPTWLRFGLPGTPEAWERLRTALRRE